MTVEVVALTGRLAVDELTVEDAWEVENGGQEDGIPISFSTLRSVASGNGWEDDCASDGRFLHSFALQLEQNLLCFAQVQKRQAPFWAQAQHREAAGGFSIVNCKDTTMDSRSTSTSTYHYPY